MIYLQNAPNILTLSRIILALFFLLALFLPVKGSNLIALLVFVLASITDYLDGKIARWQNSVSELGAFLDPLADKVLVIGAFIAFVELKLVAGWMLVIIIAREFLITGLRLVAASRKESLPASRIAKHKTFSQMFAIYLILVYLCLEDSIFFKRYLFYFQAVINVFLYLMIFLTIVSGLGYLYHQRDVFKRR